MIFLIQIFKLLDENSRRDLYELLSFDCSDKYEEAIELGYTPFESFEAMLIDRFGVSVDFTLSQADMITKALFDKNKIRQAYKLINLLK